MRTCSPALAAALALGLSLAPEARSQALQLEEIEVDGLFSVGQADESVTLDGGFTVPLSTYALGDTPLDLRLFTAGSFGAGDLDGWHYGEATDEIMLQGGIEAEDVIPDPDLRLTPRLSFLYGRSGESGGLDGLSTGGGSFFSDDGFTGERYGAELGLYADVPIAGEFSFFLDGAARVTHDDTRGAPGLGAELAGQPFLSGDDGYPESGWHLGGTVGGGFALDWRQLRGSIGARFESRQVPGFRTDGDEPASLDLESDDAWILEAQVKLRF